ncbi:response regulator [Kordiimonas pumila]|uniref:Response regulator n=1 Tax=Kordiimonas pumila TaxID=2161677 RepID=A0ABV7D177_9PROT|nr:response regulator [Kordiimonas pumila]
MARILVVEDEESVRDFVSRALTMHGYSILTACDGAEAVSIMNEHHFDLLLSDIAMPMMDGISLALKVRATRPHVPILLMTGYADERQRAHNLSLLIEGLLAKPFNLEQLLTAVSDALKKSKVIEKSDQTA